MNLKDAFKYQTKLHDIVAELDSYLRTVSVRTELHKKSASLPSATDEVVDISVERRFDCETDNIIKAICAITNERIMLNRAIYKAKHDLTILYDIDIDCLTVNNKMLHDLQRLLHTLYNKRDTTYKHTGNACTLSSDGNSSITYTYPIEGTIVYDYNKDDVKMAYKHLIVQTDCNSDLIASKILSTELDFTPNFDYNDDASSIIQSICNGYYENFNICDCVY